MRPKKWKTAFILGPLFFLAGACTQTLHVGSPSQPCSPAAQFENQFGRIAVQQAGPGASVAWGVYPHIPAANYVVDVLVGSKRVDHKVQSYPPHGSINPKDLYTGAQVEITGSASNSGGTLNFGILCRSA